MKTRGSLPGFLLSFVVVFTCLQIAYLEAGRVADYWLVERATVAVAAKLFSVVDPSADVQAAGTRLVSPQARLSVLRGCEGTELYFLWIAAVLAFPASWRRRAVGLAVGLLAAYGMNQVRLMGLFYVVRDHRPHFELAHGYLAPTLLVILLGFMFWRWTNSAWVQ